MSSVEEILSLQQPPSPLEMHHGEQAQDLDVAALLDVSREVAFDQEQTQKALEEYLTQARLVIAFVSIFSRLVSSFKDSSLSNQARVELYNKLIGVLRKNQLEGVQAANSLLGQEYQKKFAKYFDEYETRVRSMELKARDSEDLNPTIASHLQKWVILLQQGLKLLSDKIGSSLVNIQLSSVLSDSVPFNAFFKKPEQQDKLALNPALWNDQTSTGESLYSQEQQSDLLPQDNDEFFGSLGELLSGLPSKTAIQVEGFDIAIQYLQSLTDPIDLKDAVSVQINEQVDNEVSSGYRINLNSLTPIFQQAKRLIDDKKLAVENHFRTQRTDSSEGQQQSKALLYVVLGVFDALRQNQIPDNTAANAPGPRNQVRMRLQQLVGKRGSGEQTQTTAQDESKVSPLEAHVETLSPDLYDAFVFGKTLVPKQ